MTEGGPRQKPPPPPPQALRGARNPAQPGQSARPAPSSEGILVNPPGACARQLERLRQLLPEAVRGTLLIDSRNAVIAGGRAIGIREGDLLLVDYSPQFSRVQIPPSMKNIASSGGMKLFLEITDNETLICAGDSLGQKKLYSRIL